jgi:hypothetical protein
MQVQTDTVITKIYFGKDRNCGCDGKYAYPGTKLFTRFLNKIKTLESAEVSSGCNFVNYSLDKNKAFTIYNTGTKV